MRERSAAFTRSQCDACGSVLSAIELVPIFSWLWLRGTCKSCGVRISPIYLIVEILALVITGWALAVAGGSMVWLTAALGWVLLALAVMDLRFQILADIFTLPLVAVGIVSSSMSSQYAWWEHLLGAVLGAATLWGINWLYRLYRSRDGLGMGDIKLLAAAGAWLTYRGLPSTLLYATIVALAVVVIGRLAGRAVSRDMRIPFGAYLCLGFWLTWLYGPLEFGAAS